MSDASAIGRFQVQRRDDPIGSFAPIGPELRPSSGAGEYATVDPSALAGRTYDYLLEIGRTDGISQRVGPVEVRIPAEIRHLAWRGAAPNPFIDTVELALAISRSGPLAVSVYDLAGHAVAELHSGEAGPGLLKLTWNGRGRAGTLLPPGVYMLRAAMGKEVALRRLIRLR